VGAHAAARDAARGVGGFEGDASNAIANLDRYRYCFGFGLFVRSAISRSFRAISIGSPLKNEVSGLEPDLMPRGSDLSLDNLDG
jgi:hypothetical protein